MVTRYKENKEQLVSFETLLNEYSRSDRPSRLGTPTVAYCVGQFHLSANYFGNLIKKETGVSAQEYIMSKTMETVKEMLSDSSKSISEVAYELGYLYLQHSSRAFKRITGCSPNKYRTSN